MNGFLIWFADSPYASYARVFLTVVASLAIADWAKVGVFDFTNWQLWLITALASTFPVGARLLNRKDKISL